jgi:hypothetical protein
VCSHIWFFPNVYGEELRVSVVQAGPPEETSSAFVLFCFVLFWWDWDFRLAKQSC